MRSSRVTGSDVLTKIVALFLVFIAVLGMFGKLRMPRLPGLERLKRIGNKRCPDCGRFVIGKGPCPCGREKS